MKKELLKKLDETYKNLIIEGSVASGKTTNIMFQIVENAINNSQNLFILDSKEEYVNRYYDKLRENNYNTVILNLKDIDKSDGWNPLEYPYTLYKKGEMDKVQEHLEILSKVIFCDDTCSNVDSFYSSVVSDLFVGTVLALFEDVNVSEVNFYSIYNMFNYIYTKLGDSDYFTEYFKTKNVMSKSYMFASSTFLSSSDTKARIIAEAKRKLRLYVSREKLTKFLAKTTFDFESFVSKKTAIILITRDDNKSFNGVITMFIQQLYAMLVAQHVCSFDFILDNFDDILLYDLIDDLGSCLSRGMRFYLVTRSLNEISKRYGDYVFKLCDLVSIKNNELRLIINNNEVSFPKEFEAVEKKNTFIQRTYPNLENIQVNVFDLEGYVKNKRKSEVVSDIINTDFSENILQDKIITNSNINNNIPLSIPSVNVIDQLIKKTDDDIEKVAFNQNISKVNSDNKIVSELQQFRID